MPSYLKKMTTYTFNEVTINIKDESDVLLFENLFAQRVDITESEELDTVSQLDKGYKEYEELDTKGELLIEGLFFSKSFQKDIAFDKTKKYNIDILFDDGIAFTCIGSKPNQIRISGTDNDSIIISASYNAEKIL